MRIFKFNGEEITDPVVILIEDLEGARALHHTIYEDGKVVTGLFIRGVQDTTRDEAIDAALLIQERWGTPGLIVTGIREPGDDHMRPI